MLQYDAAGEAYRGQHNAAWRATVAAHVSAAYHRAALQQPSREPQALLEAVRCTLECMHVDLSGSRRWHGSAHACGLASRAHPHQAGGESTCMQALEEVAHVHVTRRGAVAKGSSVLRAEERTASCGAQLLRRHSASMPKGTHAAAAAAAQVKRGRAGFAVPPPLQVSRAGLWREYIRAAWPAAQDAVDKRNRRRKHPLAPRPLCRQVGAAPVPICTHTSMSCGEASGAGAESFGGAVLRCTGRSQAQAGCLEGV